MPVNTGSKAYREMLPKWQRCRDAYEGEDRIKEEGTKYLPLLDSHKSGSDKKYTAYLKRAMFYNATARTVDALAGAVFQKPPQVTVEESVRAHTEDVTLTDEPLEVFALKAMSEVILMGRYGVHVDMPPDGGRPYWAAYRAEDILETKTERVMGDQVLTRVILREMPEESEAGDRFASKGVEQMRVLELDEGGYSQTLFRNDPERKEWIQHGPIMRPIRNSAPLDFIPFAPIGPLGVSARIAKPPMLDLVDVNFSHYRTMADLEHGRHKVAMPQPVVSGVASDGTPLYMGGEVAWTLPSKDAKAYMLEFSGQGLGALEKADEEKRHKMQVLGARLLEDQPKSRVNETAAAVSMRHAGEQATLRTIAGSVGAGLTLALRWHAWWFLQAAEGRDQSVTVSLNKDFSGALMDAPTIQAIVQAVQAGVMSFETAYENLKRGDRTRPGVTAEQELATIAARSAALPTGTNG